MTKADYQKIKSNIDYFGFLLKYSEKIIGCLEANKSI